MCDWLKKLKVVHVLSLVDCCHHSLMSFLNIAIFDKTVITLETIMSLAILFPFSLASSRPFSSWSMRKTQCCVGSYGPIILTALPRGLFCKSPHRTCKYIVVSQGLLLAQILLNGQSSATGRLTVLLNDFLFYQPVYYGAEF